MKLERSWIRGQIKKGLKVLVKEVQFYPEKWGNIEELVVEWWHQVYVEKYSDCSLKKMSPWKVQRTKLRASRTAPHNYSITIFFFFSSVTKILLQVHHNYQFTCVAVYWQSVFCGPYVKGEVSNSHPSRTSMSSEIAIRHLAELLHGWLNYTM